MAKIFGQTSPLQIAARPINFNPLTPHIFPLTHKTSLLDFDRTRTLFHPVVKIQSRISDSSVAPHVFVRSYMTPSPKLIELSTSHRPSKKSFVVDMVSFNLFNNLPHGNIFRAIFFFSFSSAFGGNKIFGTRDLRSPLHLGELRMFLNQTSRCEKDMFS